VCYEFRVQTRNRRVDDPRGDEISAEFPIQPKEGKVDAVIEIETESHISHRAADQDAAAATVHDESHGKPLRITKRPRDTWVISKGALGIASTATSATRRENCCQSHGDKVPPFASYMHETGTDLERFAQSDRVEHGHGG